MRRPEDHGQDRDRDRDLGHEDQVVQRLSRFPDEKRIHDADCRRIATAPTRTGTIWRRTGPLDRSQRRPRATTRSTEPSEISTRWIVSMHVGGALVRRDAQRRSGRSRAPGTGARGTRAGRSRTGRCRRSRRSAREVRRPVGTDSRNRANPAAHRSVSQIPAVYTTGFGTRVSVRPSSHSIPTVVISGPRRLAGRRAQMKVPQATNDQPTSTSQHRPERERAELGGADEHPQAERARGDQEQGANPGDGCRRSRRRQRAGQWRPPFGCRHRPTRAGPTQQGQP